MKFHLVTCRKAQNTAKTKPRCHPYKEAKICIEAGARWNPELCKMFIYTGRITRQFSGGADWLNIAPKPPAPADSVLNDHKTQIKCPKSHLYTAVRERECVCIWVWSNPSTGYFVNTRASQNN